MRTSKSNGNDNATGSKSGTAAVKPNAVATNTKDNPKKKATGDKGDAPVRRFKTKPSVLKRIIIKERLFRSMKEIVESIINNAIGTYAAPVNLICKICV